MTSREERELRDRFAGQAMAGMLADWPEGVVLDHSKLAREAYALADAMLRERRGQRPKYTLRAIAGA